MPHWNEFGVFAQVVRSGSFSAAAVELGISKAAVSDHVKRLEQRLGVRLLHRTTRTLALTAAGEACYRHCQRLTEEADLAERAAVSLHRKPTGLLRISAPATFGAMHVAPAIASMIRDNPGLRVDLSLSASAVDLVREKFDVAVRIGALPSSTLVARRLATTRQIVVAAPDYLERRGIPQSLEDVAGHDVLQFSPLGWGEEWRLGGNDPSRERRVPVQVRFASDSGEALVAAACAGVGLALLPNWMVHREVTAGALVHLLPEWARSDVPVHALHPSAGRVPAKVRVCIEALLRHFGRRPYWEL